MDTIILFENLHERHGENYSDSQLRLWARMYVNGFHKDLDIPPNVPAILSVGVRAKIKANISQKLLQEQQQQ